MKPNSIRRQKGVILLLMFMLLFITGAGLFLGAVSTRDVDMRRQQEIRYQLEEAKEALLSYAMSYEDFDIDGDGDGDSDDEGPGRLPCPDTDDDGLPNDDPLSECADNVRGRLPEYTLISGSRFNFNDEYTGIDQQFWYVVSPSFKQVTTAPMNSNVAGTFTVDGVGGYVAVIIAPGDALSSQDRLTYPTTASQYLEAGNVSGTDFVNSYPSDPDNFNDVVLGITQEELMTLVTLKVAEQVKIVLDRHHDSDYYWNFYPYWDFTPYPYYPDVEDTYDATDPWGFHRAMDRAIDGTNYYWLSVNDNDYDWFDDDQWEQIVTYDYLDVDTATLVFQGCGITFMLVHDGDITRSQPNC